MSEGNEQFTKEYIQQQLTDMNRYNPENQVILILLIFFLINLNF